MSAQRRTGDHQDEGLSGVVCALLYDVLQVKSPAPPTIALVGLPGMLAGENVIGAVRARTTHLAG